ncbi:hypothetical protein [Nocardiopsis nanhaiensis]
MSSTPESPEPRERTEAVPRAKVPGPTPWLVGIVWVAVLTPVLGVVVTASVALVRIEAEHGGDGGMLLSGLGGFALAVGALFWFRWWMRRQAASRPEELPVAVGVAAVTGTVVGFLRLEWGVVGESAPVMLPLGYAVLALAGAAVVWTMPPQRMRVVFASGLVLVLCAAAVGLSWQQRVADDRDSNDELSQEVAAVGHPIGALDAPGWEPTQMWVTAATGVVITYVPQDHQVAGDGFLLRLRTEQVDPEVDRSRPEWRNCSVDGGSLPCEEHGRVVLVDESEEGPYVEARVKVEEGVVATLSGQMRGDAELEMPDVDMVALAEQIRTVEGEGAQRVVESVR